MAELTAAQIEAERVRFEQWANAEGFNINRDSSIKYIDYHRATTRWAWLAWLARASEVADQGEAVAWQGRQRSPDPDDNNEWGPWRDIGGSEFLHGWGVRVNTWPDRYELRTLFTRPAAPGWKLVPIEPTEEMWTAGRAPVMYRDLKFHVPASMEAPPWRINPTTGKVEMDQSKGTTAVHVWRAMLAAAPSPKGDRE